MTRFTRHDLEHYVGYGMRQIARQHGIPEKLTAVVRIGSRSDTIRPHRVVFADEDGQLPALLHAGQKQRHQGGLARFPLAGQQVRSPPVTNPCHNPSTGWGVLAVT